TQNARAFVRKFDSSGIPLWTRELDYPSSATVIASSGSGVYVGGNTEFGDPPFSSRDAFLRRYDADGTELWTRHFGSAEHDYVRSVVADSTGAYVVGWSVPEPNPVQIRSYTLRKFSPDGDELWARSFQDSVD